MNTLTVTTLPGQLVQINAHTEVDQVSSTSGTTFSYELIQRLRRNGDLITDVHVAGGGSKQVGVAFPQDEEPVIIWADVPPPGTHVYTITIQIINAVNVGSVTAESRSLHAIVIQT
ncbi:hypothetical protein [Paenibacillus mucilaginosus]|uniref:Uncharacterized protein n=1 Tax=Paenibacillus mucilaginosus (strain KNP414) TaxID=1036673 RepID=F8FHB1_PAEMK|nr:hypothetical protein [Paenibacillus mucilaginosus]AEI39813.1 hypothetical protein KNP414_01248 [Paenibacillus mucilaginosus KNP414]WFA17283.1 hypothetical protein ERY13_08275 [Paenibacillus mucilaginosus]